MSVAQETPVRRLKTPQPASAPPQRPLVRLSPSSDGAHARTQARAGGRVLGIRVSLCCWLSDLASPSATSPANAVSVAIVQGTGVAERPDRCWRARRSMIIQDSGARRSDDARNGFRLGKFDLVIEPDGKGGFAYRYDPARPESVLAKAEVNEALQAAAGRKDAVATTAVTSSEPGSRYIDFLIPGLLGMNLMNSGMWGIGFALVDMRQRKLLKRFVGTPMRRGDFLMALASSRLILMIIEVGLLLALWRRSSFTCAFSDRSASIALIAAIGSLTFGGVGLLTASRAQKIESVSGLINLVMMPMWIFSGVFFSYERFPAVIHPLIKALPLTALNDALRASILEGTPILHQWPRLLVMVCLGRGFVRAGAEVVSLDLAGSQDEASVNNIVQNSSLLRSGPGRSSIASNVRTRPSAVLAKVLRLLG